MGPQALQETVGEGCRAARVFFNGVARSGIASGNAFWSVECSDGRRYMVMIPPNVDATRVMRCSELRRSESATASRSLTGSVDEISRSIGVALWLKFPRKASSARPAAHWRTATRVWWSNELLLAAIASPGIGLCAPIEQFRTTNVLSTECPMRPARARRRPRRTLT